MSEVVMEEGDACQSQDLSLIFQNPLNVIEEKNISPSPTATIKSETHQDDLT